MTNLCAEGCSVRELLESEGKEGLCPFMELQLLEEEIGLVNHAIRVLGQLAGSSGSGTYMASLAGRAVGDAQIRLIQPLLVFRSDASSRANSCPYKSNPDTLPEIISVVEIRSRIAEQF